MGEFERIVNLPSRVWDDASVAAAQEALTGHLRSPHGRMQLRPLQAVALADAYEVGGLFAPIGVGLGKTLTSFLLPSVLRAKRPLLMVPSSLVIKSQIEWERLQEDWHLAPIEIWSYDRLSSAKGEAMLHALQPDLIVADECHKLKSSRSARTRRFLHYMKTHPQTKFCALSGTVTRKSLLDFWHLIGLALGKSSPVPLSYETVKHWAQVLDSESLDVRLGGWDTPVSRPAPGMLLEFSTPEDWAGAEDHWHVARRGFRRRLVASPGVVASQEAEVDATLILRRLQVDVPEAIRRGLHELRTTYCTPNGDELTEAKEVWRHARELQCGFWYKWDPGPPEEWLVARKKWNKFVRRALAAQTPGVNSPADVANRHPHEPAYHEWRQVRHLYDPLKHQVAMWVSDYLLEEAARWLADVKGIVWVEHSTVGRRLSELSGAPYYAGGDAASRAVMDARGPIICSIKAHGTGQNLQHGYHRSLIMSPPTSGDAWEQLLGRTHRVGQIADEVEYDFFSVCEETESGLYKSFLDAKYTQAVMGQEQKLLLATLIGCERLRDS